jgi:type IV pilus assembly protein PilC
MAEFVCKVADAAGKVFSQVEAAQSVTEARQKLADRGLYVYSVRQRGGLLPQLLGKRRDRVVGGSDFLIFNQQFNTLIKAGLPILKALDLLAERAASPRLRPLLVDVRQRVRNGASLSEALEQQAVFPKVYCTSVLAGERSGNLTGVLDYYIAYQRVSTGFRRKLLASLVYPVLLVTFATGIVLYLVSYVIPQFAMLYSDLNVPLPAPTRLLTTLTLEYRWYALAVLALIILSLVGVYLWSRTEPGGRAVDRFKLRLPVFGQTWIKFHVAQLCRTLSTLLAGGTPLVAALETSAGAAGTPLVIEAVAKAATRVREGQTLHASLAETRLIPEVALEMVEVGEATGALAPMLSSVAEFYEEEVNLRLQALAGLISPLILLFVAGVVLFILIALYLPVFSFSLGGTTG